MREVDKSQWVDRTPSLGYFASHRGMVIEVESSFLAFSITFESGDVIRDTFGGMSERKAMYERIEPDLYKALLRIVYQVQGNKNIYGDYQFAKFPLGYARYQLSVHTPTEMCWIRYPEFVRSFKANEVYLRNPELPIIEDGRINRGVRKKISDLGIEIPDTPYELGFRVLD